MNGTIAQVAVSYYPPTVKGLKALRRPVGLPIIPPSPKELHDLRVSVKLSQAAASEAIGITPSHLSRVEAGQRRLRLRQALLLQSIYLNIETSTSPATARMSGAITTAVTPIRPITGGSDRPDRATAEQLQRLAVTFNARRL